MGARRRLIGLVAGSAVLLAACSSCQSKPPPVEDAPPPDRLAKDEVVEGKERAFGLPLPRVAHVSARFSDTVDIKTPLQPEQLANFVRARVKGGDVTPGATTTMLANVTPRDDANKRLTIEIRAVKSGDGTRSQMVVHDTTPAPVEPGLTDEARWKKAGFTPDGKVLDPKHAE